jgi:ribosomal protein L21E
MDILGKVILLGETITVGSAGTFKKRTIVVETSEQYAQSIPIDFVQDKCNILNAYKVGDNVKIGINIRGNEYNGKYYVSLTGCNINNTDTSSTKVKSTEVVDELTDLPF